MNEILQAHKLTNSFQGGIMLTFDEVLNLNYYKKTSYSGWINGMRFLIRREQQEDQTDIFHAWVWPGPFIFDLTDEEKKSDFTAPFSDNGKQEVVDWINEQYLNHSELWSQEHKTL